MTIASHLVKSSVSNDICGDIGFFFAHLLSSACEIHTTYCLVLREANIVSQ